MPTEPQSRQSMAARILDWVRKCLIHIQQTVIRAAGSRVAHARLPGDPTGAPCRMTDSDAIGALLAKLHAAKVDATAGMIQMVQLSDVRAAFGEQWPQVAETAMSVAETLLAHRLNQSDIFSRYLDYGYVVVFTKLDCEMAERRAETLSQEISLLLLKMPELKGKFGAQQVTGGISELTTAEDGDPVQTMTRELAARSESKSRQNGTIPVSDSANAAPGAKATSTAPVPLEPPAASKKPPATQNVAGVMATPTAPAETKKKPSEPALVAMYEPMLLVPRQTVAISVAIPRRRGNDGEWLTGQSAYTRGLGGGHNLSLDLFMCNQVVSDLKRGTKAGTPSIVAAMTRIESLNASSKFAERYDKLTEAERGRLILQIVVLDADTPVSKIDEHFGRYQNITKNIVLLLDATNTDLREYTGTRVGAVGCCLNKAETDAGSTGRNVELVEAFASSAQDAKLRCYIQGIEDAESYAAAMAAGAQYISGGIIGPLVNSPFAPYPFNAAASSDAA